MPNASIVTITLNPAIDKNARVDKIIPEAKLHCTNIICEAGGGGINVSKALKKLDTPSLAIFTCGGHTGNLLKDLLAKENIEGLPLHTHSDTRENFIVLETSTNLQFRFGMPSLPVAETIANTCFEALMNLKFKPHFIVASGSLPDGLPQNFYAEIAKYCNTIDAKFIVDTSGNALQLAAQEGVYLLKPNLAELSNWLGVKTILRHQINEAAQQILAQYRCPILVVSLGAEGAAVATKNFFQFVPAPKVKIQSTVGAGDSMVAGMVYMLLQNQPLLDMVKFGVACGSAATLNAGTQLFNKQDALNLFAQMGH